MLRKIVSGGQTGADRAALDWARTTRGVIEHGGWCPKGRRAEDGRIEDCYLLDETPADGYSQRTEWNVRDSDATVVFSLAPVLSGGSALTIGFAKKWKRPCLHLSQVKSANPVDELNRFVDEYFVEALNVAGPRASGEPNVAEFVTTVLEEAFSQQI